MRSERPDLRPKKPDLRPERPDLRPERPDMGLRGLICDLRGFGGVGLNPTAATKFSLDLILVKTGLVFQMNMRI